MHDVTTLGAAAAARMPAAQPGGAAPPRTPRWLRTAAFVGELWLATGRAVTGRGHLRLRDLWWQFEQVGARSVPIIALVCGLTGVILAYMGAVQLKRFGAQSFIADLVTVGAVREVAALMTGIVLAGRVGASFSAQLASMVANEEIDALRALGLPPMEFLVVPRVAALVLAAPLLTASAAAVCMVTGGVAAVTIFGVSPVDYWNRTLNSLTVAHVLTGLSKGTIYAMLVAIAGCLQGLHAGRSARAVGEATTAAVVQSIVWIAAAAALTTVAYQRLGW